MVTGAARRLVPLGDVLLAVGDAGALSERDPLHCLQEAARLHGRAGRLEASLAELLHLLRGALAVGSAALPPVLACRRDLVAKA